MSDYDWGSLDAGPEAVDIPSTDFSFTNFNNPAIENPFQSALTNTLVGDPDDVQVPASVLAEFKNLYTPAELGSILDDYVKQTGDTETGVLLKNLFGTDTSLSDTALADAKKMSANAGDISSTGKYTTEQLTKIGDDAAKKMAEDDKKNTNPLKRLLSGEGTGSDLLSGLLAAYMAREAYKESQRSKSLGAVAGKNAPVTATRTAYKGTKYAAQGGLMGLAEGGKTKQPYYLGGSTDGMADKVPAHIDRKRPAALSDGEFVIPADVVSHLGNGNSNAGAKRLYEMMDRIRSARTGNSKQGKQINPDRFLPR